MSRWHYWWAYVAILVLALFTMWLSDRAYDAAAWIFGFATFFLLVVSEAVIRWQRVEVKPNEVVMAHGLFKPVVTRVGYDEFGRVEVRQSRVGAALRVGDVIVRRPGAKNIGLVGFAYPMKMKRLLLEHLRAAHEHHEHKVSE